MSATEPAPAATATPSSARPLLWIACLAFVAVGMAQAAIGPSLPDLSRRTGAGTVAVGGALSALFAGSLLSFMVTGMLLRRYGHVRILLGGWSLFALGVAGVATSRGLGALLACAGALGMGSAAVVLSGNVLAAQASRGAGALNLVNAMFGVGAIASSALIGLSISMLGSGLPTFALVVGVSLAGIAWLALRHGAAVAPVATPKEDRPGAAGRHRLEVLRTPLLWAICAFCFVSVSIEISLNGWLPTLLNRAAGMTPAAGAAVLSWVWVLMTAVRFATAWLDRHLAPRQILRGCAVLTLVGTAMMVGAAALQSAALCIAAASVLGLGIAPTMPALLAIVQAAFPHDAGWATGLMMAVGSIGAAVVPWALGAVVVASGATAGATMLLVAAMAMGVLRVVVESGFRHRDAGASATRP